MKALLKSAELDFTVLDLYEDYVVSTFREDSILNLEELQEIISICLDFYRDRKYVYITRRINNYNVNPVIYLNLQDAENLAGIAVVCHQSSSVKTANFEKNFAKIPFEIFSELEDACNWAEKTSKE